MKFNFLQNVVLLLLLSVIAFGCKNQSLPNNSDTKGKKAPDQVQSTSQFPSPETIKFESADKVEIVGTFYQSPKADSPAVLLLHQWRSDRHSFDEFAKHLQTKGFGVLSIDGRGFGDSIKTTDGKTISAERSDDAVKGMKADVGNAFVFLAKQKNVDPEDIGIIGASYGSSLAIIYASENPIVKAVALLSPGLNYFGNMPTMPAVKKYGNRPLLLVAAENDRASAASVRKLRDGGTNDKFKIQIYSKGGHGTGILKAKVGLEDLLTKFLKKNL